MTRSKLGSLVRNLLRYFSIKQTPTEPAKQNICLDEVSEHDCIIVQLPRSNENICINSSTNWAAHLSLDYNPLTLVLNFSDSDKFRFMSTKNWSPVLGSGWGCPTGELQNKLFLEDFHATFVFKIEFEWTKFHYIPSFSQGRLLWYKREGGYKRWNSTDVRSCSWSVLSCLAPQAPSQALRWYLLTFFPVEQTFFLGVPWRSVQF